mmetsp:Transcript_13119/g.24430  ORF Transcript_13119/g.24430 Transcript_13119/m.24430 type:complete len:214 (-) Transcript_13119:986-1627(-)
MACWRAIGVKPAEEAAEVDAQSGTGAPEGQAARAIKPSASFTSFTESEQGHEESEKYQPCPRRQILQAFFQQARRLWTQTSQIRPMDSPSVSHQPKFTATSPGKKSPKAKTVQRKTLWEEVARVDSRWTPLTMSLRCLTGMAGRAASIPGMQLTTIGMAMMMTRMRTNALLTIPAMMRMTRFFQMVVMWKLVTIPLSTSPPRRMLQPRREGSH